MVAMIAVVDIEAARKVLHERYAPGRPPGVRWGLAYLPLGSEIPDFSVDEWDGCFIMASHVNIALLYWKRAPQTVQLELWG